MNDVSIKQSSALYRTIWRWHFYAGIFCLPFVMTLAITGSIYLFKPQIDAWLDKPYQKLEVDGVRNKPNIIIQTAIDAVPGSEFYNYRLPTTDTQAVVISVFRDEQRYLVYVNPYTLEVLKNIVYDDQFIQIVRGFHGELLSGTMGSIIVELAGCWAIVLIVTGLYLWWPRSAKGLAGILYPRLSLEGRNFWKDLHAVIGIWISVFALFLLISGLPWALVWGSAFKEVRKYGDEMVQQNWTVSGKEIKQSWSSSSVSVFDLSPELLAKAKALKFSPPVELSVSNEVDNIWKLSSIDQNRMLRSDAWLSGSSAQVQRMKSFSDGKTIDKVIGIGIAAHEGQLFGWANQLLGMLTTLGLMLMSVSGFILWRKRKFKNQLGAPPPMPSVRVGKVVALIVLTLAVLLPLLMVSLLAIFILEFALLRRVEALRSWLGLKPI